MWKFIKLCFLIPLFASVAIIGIMACSFFYYLANMGA